MNKKITSLLVICLAALTIIYGCSSAALSSYIMRSVDGVPSEPVTAAEDPRQNAKLPHSKPHLEILGDPVDDVKPH